MQLLHLANQTEFMVSFSAQSLFFLLYFHSFLKRSLLNLLQHCLHFMFWVPGHMACEILVPQPGTEPGLPVLEGEVLIIGLPRRPLCFHS